MNDPVRSSRQYWLYLDQWRGPYTLEQIRLMWLDGSISKDTPHWQKGYADGLPLSAIFNGPPQPQTSVSPPLPVGNLSAVKMARFLGFSQASWKSAGRRVFARAAYIIVFSVVGAAVNVGVAGHLSHIGPLLCQIVAMAVVFIAARRMAAGADKEKALLWALLVSAIIGFSAYQLVGTSTESSDDPVYGRNDYQEDFTPSMHQRQRAGWTAFLLCFASSGVGVYLADKKKGAATIREP